MNSLVILAGAIAVFALGYRYYSSFIANKVLKLKDDEQTPSTAINDGVDYVPTRPSVLFGHHFASIAGLGPIVGPAIAVIWGWLPALLWVVFGSVFIGAVHDFIALALSVRHQGKSIGDIAHGIIGNRGRTLFLFIIFFTLLLVVAVFVLVVADLWTYFGNDPGAEGVRAYPEAVLPSLGLILLAVIVGLILRRRPELFRPVMTIGVILAFSFIALGIIFPLFLASKGIWVIVLLAYALAASILPVWLLLQPRDFLSSFNLYAMLILLFAGIIFSAPVMTAPAINQEVLNNPQTSLPLIFPFLFITVACGAISGFHCLVSSGTSSKQLHHMSEARVVGYGGMITEGLLAVLVIIACCAGYLSADWNHIYATWGGSKGIAFTLQAFVNGAAHIVTSLGVPAKVGATFFTVTIVAFALTTLDTGMRLLRYTVQELAAALKLPAFFSKRSVAAFISVFGVLPLVFIQIGGKPAGVSLWKLFGTSNQLLGAVALLVASLYLFKMKRPSWVTAIPMLFMMAVTSAALTLSLIDWWSGGFLLNAQLIIVGNIILFLLLWLIVEAVISFVKELKLRKLAKIETALG